MKSLESGGSQSQKRSRGPKQPPLEREDILETDPAGGYTVRVTRFRRGVLRTDMRTYESPEGFVAAMSELAKYSPRGSLEQLCEGLRDYLETQGFPSDRQPLWIKVGGEWREMSIDEKPARFCTMARWNKRVEDLTEPVSPERYAGALLFWLVELLKRKDIDGHLWHINKVLAFHAAYQIADQINTLAHAGLVAHAGRRSGPDTRRKRGNKIRQIVGAQATAYWDARPVLRGNASTTAASIADAVNETLRAEGLLPRGKSGLSVKRIGDYIREGIRG